MKKIIAAGAVFAALATSAVAADLPSRRAPVYAPAVAPVFAAWNGSYVGLNAGYSWFKNSTPEVKGAEIGLRAGHDWQIAGPWVVGVLFDGAYSWAKGTSAIGPTVIRSKWDLSADARVGYALGSQALVYALGGLSYRTLDVKFAGLKVPGMDDYALGFNVGAGLEYRVAPNWSVYGEYRFNRLFPETPAGQKTGNVHDVKLGVNYRFGSAAPVVAKY
jgi:outer membrane immunogenic protein